jgi:hypothetical protein
MELAISGQAPELMRPPSREESRESVSPVSVRIQDMNRRWGQSLRSSLPFCLEHLA